MKKIISIVTVFFVVVCSTLICSDVVDAQGAALIFDLDINYTEENGLKLSNKVEGSTVFGDITYGTRNSTATNGYQEHSPIYKKNDLGAGYLTFAEYETSSTADTVANRASAVKIALKSAYQGGVFANIQPISYEIWARPNSNYGSSSSSWGALLGVGADSSSNSSGVYAYQLRFTNGSGKYNYNQADNAGTAANASLATSLTAHLDEWTHYVLTREYDATNLKWIYKFYANGVLIEAVENEVTALYDYTTKSTDNSPINYLIIGNGAGSDRYRAFIGDIAAFRVYNGLLDADYIKNAYKNELGNYIKLIEASHNLAEIDPDADEFEIYFSEAPLPSTVTDEICIKTAAGEKVATKFKSYDEMSKKVVFNLLDYLDAGEIYTLYLDKVTDKNGFSLKSSQASFVAKAKSNSVTASSCAGIMKDANGAETQSIAEAKTAEISMNVTNSTESDKTIAMAMIIYDETGRLLKMIRSENVLLKTGRQNLPIKVTTAGDESLVLKAGYRIKAIAWSVEETAGAIAFSVPVELK